MTKKTKPSIGKQMMDTASYIMTGAGGFLIFLGIVNFFTVLNRVNQYPDTYPPLLITMIYVSCALCSVIGGIELAAGIFHIKSKKPLALILSSVVVVLSIGYNVLSYTFNYRPDAINIILAFILPIVYIVGAVMNKKGN